MSKEFYSIQDLLHHTQLTSSSATKAFCHLGILPAQVAELVAGLLSITEMEFNLLPDSDGIRHTFKQHGVAKRKAEEARGQIPIVEADMLALAGWLWQPTAVYSGQIKPGKQPRVELHWFTSTGTTVAILEWRPGRQQLALVTMYKKRPAA